MKPTTILLLQSVCITLQTINAGIAAVTENAAAALIVGAVVGGFQFFVQHIGNQAMPKATALQSIDAANVMKAFEQWKQQVQAQDGQETK